MSQNTKHVILCYKKISLKAIQKSNKDILKNNSPYGKFLNKKPQTCQFCLITDFKNQNQGSHYCHDEDLNKAIKLKNQYRRGDFN